MTIFYIILSCKQYLETRLKWQRDTWLSGIDSYVVLTGSIGSTDPKIACMNTSDNYHSCPERYYQYIRENDLSAYDWIVFVDDDTFIFPKRFETYLESLDPSKSLFIGRTITWPTKFMSGGAGFTLSRLAYSELRDYLINTPKANIQFEENGDVSMGVWINKIAKAEYIECVELNGSTHLHSDSSKVDKAFSYHYVNEELFGVYGKLV
jgi:hypothetical protein